MGLFYKIRLNWAKSGKLTLKDCSITDCFDEKFVEACIQGSGCEEFQHASGWLRSDASFILKMVNKYPGILQYCEDVIYDRYVDESHILREKEIDKFFFAAKCCSENLRSFRYLSDEIANKYMNSVKKSKTIEGEFHGEKQTITLENNEYAIGRLLNIRYDIVKMGSLLSSF